MHLRVIVFALVATAVAVALVLPSAGAKPPKPTTTTIAPNPTIYLTGSFTYLTNGDFRYIYGATHRWASRSAELEPRLTLMRASLTCLPT
jgi:hypothetical protein